MICQQDDIKKIVTSIVSENKILLVKMQLRRIKRGCEIKVLVDKEGGITLDECARVNRRLRQALEENSLFLEGDILEVSSPGLDMPLKEKSDFVWAKERHVKVYAKNSQGKHEQFVAKVKAVVNETIEFEGGDGRAFRLNIDDIIKAKLEIRW